MAPGPARGVHTTADVDWTLPDAELARLLGLHRRTVARLRRADGREPLRRGRLGHSGREAGLRLLREGASPGVVAVAVGCTRRTAQRWLASMAALAR